MVQSIKPGTSSKQVLAMQKYLNKGFGYNLEESGTYDDATLKAVTEVQSQLGLSLKNGVVDEQTMLAMKEATEKRAWVTVNGVKALLTAEQLAELRSRAIAAAVAKVQPFVSMATEANTYYAAHKKVRSDNWFLSRFAEAGANATFPDEGAFKEAKRAADSLLAQARAGTATPASLKSCCATINIAFDQMSRYRAALYGGGDDFIAKLELVRDGAAIALQVLAAVATAGASLTVQVGVAASVGAYTQTLKEVDKLAKDQNYNVKQGQDNIIANAATEAGIQLLFKGTNAKEVMNKIAAEAAKKYGGKEITAYAARVASEGTQDMLKEALKLLKDFSDAKSAPELDQVAVRLASAFAVGCGLSVIGPYFKTLGKGGGGFLDKSDLSAFRKYDLDKSGEELLKKTAEKVSRPVAEGLLGNWAYDSKHATFPDKVKEKVVSHPEVVATAKEAGKGKKGKK